MTKKDEPPRKVAKTSPMMQAHGQVPGEGTLSVSPPGGPRGAPDVQSEGTIGMGPPPAEGGRGASPMHEGTVDMAPPAPASPSPLHEGTVDMAPPTRLSATSPLEASAHLSGAPTGVSMQLSNAPTDTQSEGTLGVAYVPEGGAAAGGEHLTGAGTHAPGPTPEQLAGADTWHAGRGTPPASGSGILFVEGARTPAAGPGSEVTPGTQPSLRTIAQKPLPPGGVKVGKYHLKSELGRGGMGVVFRATDLVLNREVALKLMLSQDVSEEDKERFVREAESSAALKHPYIVTLLEASSEGGVFYFSMDFIEGKTFKAVILENQANLSLTLPIFAKTCDGVGYAHRKGIIHRDLKPQNVMVDTEMDPHIMDFGLARRLDDPKATEKEKAKKAEESKKKARLTMMGALMGTPVYMPPEQAAGRIDEVDTRSDIYSLGVILYSILTGDLPFRAKSQNELLLMIEADPPPPPRSKNPACPWELERIVLKAIEKKKDDRYQTCFDLKEDIEAWLTGRPVAAVKGGSGYVLGKWVRRNKPLVAASILAAAAIGGGGAWQITEKRRAEHDRIAAIESSVSKGRDKVAVADRLIAEFPARSASLEPEKRLEYLKGADDDYGAGLDELNKILALDKDGRTAGLLDAIRAGRRSVRMLVDTETRDEERRKTEAAAASKRKEDAATLAVSATGRVRDVDPSAAKDRDAVAAAKAVVEGGYADLLKALGLDAGSAEAQVGLSIVRDRLMALQAGEEVFARRKEIAKREAEARQTIAEAATATAAKNTDLAWTKLREAVPPLAEALRLDSKAKTIREMRVDVALRLGQIALDVQRKPEVAELVVDEVADLDAARVAAFRELVKKAKEDGKRYKAAMEKADLARAREQWTEAAAAYAEAHLAAKDRPEAVFGDRYSRGSGAAKEGRHAEALSLFAEAEISAVQVVDKAALERAVARSKGAIATAAVRAAEKEVQAGQYDAALASLARARELDPENAEAKKLEADVQAMRRVPPGTLLVKAGAFTFGSGAEAREGIDVERFFVGKGEVTNKEFHEFVKAGGYEKQELWDPAGWEARAELTGKDGKPGPAGWLNGRPPEAKEALPVTGISWYEARAFARSRGKGWRLPSEIEWDKAACWDPSGRRVDPPWIARGKDGAVASSWASLWRAHYNRSEPKPTGAEVGRNTSGAPVFDRAPSGAEDMWGNVREWVVVAKPTGAGGAGGPGVGEAAAPATPVEEPGARGGSWASRVEDRSTAFKLYRPSALYRAPDMGFRLVKSSVE